VRERDTATLIIKNRSGSTALLTVAENRFWRGNNSPT
jgi:hypothetical protein